MDDPSSDKVGINADLESVLKNESPPPNTLLVRWRGELLLLDAWNLKGDKLRSVPNLIEEAITHFQVGRDTNDFRLAVREHVDGRPAVLFLGLTALRFVENGRVLDLVDMRSRTKPSSLKEIGSPNPRCEESDTETWETAPLAINRGDCYSDFSTESSSSPSPSSSSSSDREGHGYSSGSTLNEDLRCSGLSAKARSSARNRKVPRPAEAQESASVYVHPKYGAIFRHLGDHRRRSPASPSQADESEARDDFETASSPKSYNENGTEIVPTGVTYDFRDYRVLPRPVLSRPESPMASPEASAQKVPRSRPVSRSSSHVSDMSRMAGGTVIRPSTADEDPWLSSESSEKWKNVRLDR